MHREFPEFIPSTITYNENVKGWVSFKSFIPESGVSLSKDYYTIKGGRLWKHHSNAERNNFYDQATATVTNSTVTAILNQEPSLVKIFNTLNYEGSQSKINQYTVQNIMVGSTVVDQLSDVQLYNTVGEKGWYVQSITTDKQTGSITEFIEKEGKWFNYIQGSDSTPVSVSDLSVQGLGTIFSSVNVIPNGIGEFVPESGLGSGLSGSTGGGGNGGSGGTGY